MTDSIKSVIKKIVGLNIQSTQTGTYNETTRVTWLEKALQAIPEGSRILDAGAGEQQFKRFCKHLKYVSQDFAQYKPQEVESGLQMKKWDYGNLDIVSDISSIPEPDESFDAVMCTEVFEHIINPREAIKEFSRLLKSGGYLIITAPFCSLTHFAPYHYYTGFSKFFYEKELSANRFNVIEISPNGNYFEYLAQELRRVPSIAKKYSLSELTKKENKLIQKSLLMLDSFSQKDNRSSELLCFGYHVFAQKQ
jgi:ubiquinone/menaquinone biosynthesis C-methylase UbiE